MAFSRFTRLIAYLSFLISKCFDHVRNSPVSNVVNHEHQHQHTHRYGRPQLDHAILQGAPRDTQNPPQLKDSECAFVELKTHHEAWTGDKSVKRRFKLRNSELTGVSFFFFF